MHTPQKHLREKLTEGAKYCKISESFHLQSFRLYGRFILSSVVLQAIGYAQLKAIVLLLKMSYGYPLTVIVSHFSMCMYT